MTDTDTTNPYCAAGSSPPSTAATDHATNVASTELSVEQSIRQANGRINSLFGAITTEGFPHEVVEHVHGLDNEQLFPLGEAALRDIADQIVVLAEIRSRFHEAKGQLLMGYSGWKDFVSRNSAYSLRTIQRRINEATGVIDESKTNLRFRTCETCGEVFPSKNQLRKHNKNEHPTPVVTPVVTPAPAHVEQEQDKPAPVVKPAVKPVQPAVIAPAIEPSVTPSVEPRDAHACVPVGRLSIDIEAIGKAAIATAEWAERELNVATACDSVRVECVINMGQAHQSEAKQLPFIEKAAQKLMNKLAAFGWLTHDVDKALAKALDEWREQAKVEVEAPVAESTPTPKKPRRRNQNWCPECKEYVADSHVHEEELVAAGGAA